MKKFTNLACLFLLIACNPNSTTVDNTNPTPSNSKLTTFHKSDDQLRKELSPEVYRVARKAGTERPWGENYKTFKNQGKGIYRCAVCHSELFSSNEKFDSQCGWPSFYDPSKAKNVKTRIDRSLSGVRTEVICAVCDSHLGHVFEGEGFDTPTDKRYCINAIVLKFEEN